jgi:2'-5' RNA ligase
VNGEKAQVWRVFCAIELPDDVRAQLQEHTARLRKEFPDAAATRTAEQFPKFEINVGNTGVFPRPSRAQVLWIGVDDPSGQLTALQKHFDAACAALGFEKEDRAYRPHLTIARIRKPDSSRLLADTHLKMNFAVLAVRVHELILFRSELSSKGSRYTPISHHPLPNP